MKKKKIKDESFLKLTNLKLKKKKLKEMKGGQATHDEDLDYCLHDSSYTSGYIPN